MIESRTKVRDRPATPDRANPELVDTLPFMPDIAAAFPQNARG